MALGRRAESASALIEVFHLRGSEFVRVDRETVGSLSHGREPARGPWQAADATVGATTMRRITSRFVRVSAVLIALAASVDALPAAAEAGGKYRQATDIRLGTHGQRTRVVVELTSHG